MIANMSSFASLRACRGLSSRSALSSLATLLVGLGLPHLARAQGEPPLPPPIDTTAPVDTTAQPSEPTTPPTAAGAEATEGGLDEAPLPSAEPTPSTESGAWATTETYAAPTNDPTETEDAFETWWRASSIRRSSTLSGSTGVFRTREAGSGAVGTFRLGVNTAFTGQSGFLCKSTSPCFEGGVQLPDDSSQRVQALGTLSVTPLPFLEIFGGLSNSATSNSNGRPTVLQIVGDLNLGVKAFVPSAPDRLFYFGGEVELNMLTGSGGIGFGTAGFALRALGTLDLYQRTNESDRIPVRAHINLGYYFDNSANLVRGVEAAQPEGRGEPIQRTERYGLQISRVDAFEIGLAAEYVHPWFRPFLDWTLDVPVNRQGYICNIQSAASRGDLCLGVAAGFNTSPQRLTVGTRVFPWQESGLVVTLAADIGTGATTIFLEETTPEAAYNLWLGLGYTVDTQPVRPLAVAAAPSALVEPPEVRHYLVGTVVDEATANPIAFATLRYDDPDATGMVSNTNGAFRSTDLPPGEYRFVVGADGYKEGECIVRIPDNLSEAIAATPVEATESPSSDEPPLPAPLDAVTKAEEDVTSTRTPEGDWEVFVHCALKELPRVANVVAIMVDADTGAVIPGADVTITDKLDRSLELTADAKGSLQFKNVPFGTAYLTVDAPAYLRTVMPLVIDSRKDMQVHVVVNKRPGKLGVRVSPTALTLNQPIDFVGDTDQVAPQSLVVVEQLATLLREDASLGPVEIGVHTDDSGAASYSRQLSQNRADAIRDILVRLGVSKEQISTKGYGPDHPLVPNVSDEARAKNIRVEILRKKP